MKYRTLAQMCDRLYLCIFLFRVGLLTLIYSFFYGSSHIVPSLSMVWKLSTVMWPVVFWCSNIGKDAFKFSLYLSPKVLDYSPMYSSSHLNQYMKLLCFVIVSQSFGNSRRFFKVVLLWNVCEHHICYIWFCCVHKDLLHIVQLCGTSFPLGKLLDSVFC